MAAAFASAGGALDVVIVRNYDGSLRSSDWHVVFDRLDEANARVHVTVNGQLLPTTMTAAAAHTPARFESTTAEGGEERNARFNLVV